MSSSWYVINPLESEIAIEEVAIEEVDVVPANAIRFATWEEAHAALVARAKQEINFHYRAAWSAEVSLDLLEDMKAP